MVSEENFWQLVLIEGGLYTARWSLVSASGFFFFSHAELWCLGVWAVTARRDCRQGVVSLRSAFQILAVSRVSCWYPHSFLPSYLPSQASQPCFSVFICGPRQVTSLTPQLQQPGEHVDAHQPCSNLSRGVERQPMGSPLPQVVPRLF